MNDVALIDDAFDNMLAAVNSGDRAEMMRLTGQSDGDKPKQGLSRLNINYDDETEDGHSLKKGTWRLFHEGEFVYADEVTFRPMVRTFEWSVWDADEGKFTSRSVQAPTLNNSFPDTSGGFKCGRLTKSEEESLGEKHPLTLASRSAVCNIVFYALVSLKGKNANGDDITVENYPIVSYFKKSGFRPAREAIEMITEKGQLMNESVFTLSTKRMKQGSLVYYVPVFTSTGTQPLDDHTKEIFKMFLETVKASNANILEQHRESVKARETEEEVDLAADFG